MPKSLFKVRLSRAMDPWFDGTKDGRLLIPVRMDQTMNAPIIVEFNWQAGLKSRKRESFRPVGRLLVSNLRLPRQPPLLHGRKTHRTPKLDDAPGTGATTDV